MDVKGVTPQQAAENIRIAIGAFRGRYCQDCDGPTGLFLTFPLIPYTCVILPHSDFKRIIIPSGDKSTPGLEQAMLEIEASGAKIENILDLPRRSQRKLQRFEEGIQMPLVLFNTGNNWVTRNWFCDLTSYNIDVANAAQGYAT